MILDVLLDLRTLAEKALANTELMLATKKAQVDAYEEELKNVNVACMSSPPLCIKSTNRAFF